jgi:hypothetical protein
MKMKGQHGVTHYFEHGWRVSERVFNGREGRRGAWSTIQKTKSMSRMVVKGEHFYRQAARWDYRHAGDGWVCVSESTHMENPVYWSWR